MSITTNPFKSARLFYRPVESPEDDDFFHALQADPFSQATSAVGLLGPMNKAQSTDVRTKWQAAYLNAIICLPTTDENLALAGGTYKKEDFLKPSLIRDEPFDHGIPVGAICLIRDARAQTLHHSKGRVGLDIAPKYQRKGYGREALNWLIDWGFVHANLHRIEINVLEWNTHAIRLYKSVGFKLESHQREAWWHNGRWQDDFGLAILEHEWKQLRHQGSD